jgi:hypothetical protein
LFYLFLCDTLTSNKVAYGNISEFISLTDQSATDLLNP